MVEAMAEEVEARVEGVGAAGGEAGGGDGLGSIGMAAAGREVEVAGEGGGVVVGAQADGVSSVAGSGGASLATRQLAELTAEAHKVVAALWRAGRAPYMPVADTLALADSQPSAVAVGSGSGALLRAQVARGRVVHYTRTAVEYSPDAELRAAAAAARASGAIVVHVEGAKGSAMALSNAPTALRGAFSVAYGGEAQRLWRELVEAAPDRLLPCTRRAYEAAKVSVAAEAGAAAAAGEARERTQQSINARARAILLLAELREEFSGGGGGTTLPSLLRRAVRSSTALVRGNEPGQHLAHWHDLDAMVGASGWRRETRQSSGYLAPCAERPEGGFDPALRPAKEGYMPHLDAGGLVREWAATFGEPADDHPIWTIAAHGHAHVPALEPHLVSAVAAHLAAGKGPLRLYHEGKRRYTPEEVVMGRAEFKRLRGLGILEGPLSAEQLADPSYCALITRMGITFKGSPSLSGEEKAAVGAGDVPRIAALALERARALALKIVADIDSAKAAGRPLRPGAALAAARSSLIGQVTKVRPVNEACGLGAVGWASAGLSPYGVHKYSFSYPTTTEMLEGVARGFLVGKMDIKDFYYFLAIHPDYRRYCCVLVDFDDEAGEEVYRMTRASMGWVDSAGCAQGISSAITIIANARLGGVLAGGGAKPMMDDIIMALRAAYAGRGEAVFECFEQLFRAAALIEARHKRCEFATSHEVVGRQWDLAKGMVSLPPYKAHKYLIDVALARELLQHEREEVRDEVTTTYLETVTGELNWYAEATATGCTRLGPLHAITMFGNSTRNAGRRLAAVECLSWWLTEAGAGRLQGVQMVDGVEREEVDEVQIDASAVAVCAFCVRTKRLAWRLLTAAELNEAATGVAASSGLRELLAAELAALCFGPSQAGRKVAILTDATACLGPLHAGRASGRGNEVTRRIYETFARHGVTHLAFWLPREANVVADAGSKLGSLAAAQAFCTAHGYTLCV